MRRLVAGSAAFVAALLGSFVFFVPAGHAAGVVPLGLCGSLCSPAAPGIVAELGAQSGGAGAGLTAAESTAFNGIVSGYGATATTSGSSIVAAGSAAGTSSAGPLLTGAGAALLSGGVYAWSGTLGDSSALATLPAPPAGPTFTYLFNDNGTTSANAYFTALTTNTSGNVTGGTFVNPNGSTGVGDYGCSAEVYYAAVGTAMPATLSAMSAAQTAGTVKVQNVLSKGFGNGGACTGSAAKSWTVASPTRGTINTAWVIVGLSISVFSTVVGSPVRWYSSVTAGSTGTPNRYVEQTITCTNSSGGTSTVTNSTGAAAWSAGDMVTLAGLMCPSGTRLTSWQATAKTPGAADTPLGSESVTRDPSDPCGYVGGTLCIARVEHRVTVSGSTSWETCTAAITACATWWTDPARDQNFRCVYGASTVFNVVGIGVCSIYRHSFVTDGTQSIDNPVPPGGGEPAPTGCDMSWSSVLDGTIVFKAVSCALSWAFVPDSATVEALQAQAAADWNGSPPGLLLTAIGDAFGPLGDLTAGDSDACGITVDFPYAAGHSTSFTLLDACHPPFDTWAPVFKAFMTVFVLLEGAYACYRALGIGFGVGVPPRAPEQLTLF